MALFRNDSNKVISFSKTVGDGERSVWYNVDAGKTVEISDEEVELLKTARHEENVKKGLVEVKGVAALVEKANIKKEEKEELKKNLKK